MFGFSFQVAIHADSNLEANKETHTHKQLRQQVKTKAFKFNLKASKQITREKYKCLFAQYNFN